MAPPSDLVFGVDSYMSVHVYNLASMDIVQTLTGHDSAVKAVYR